jgi:general secretion pathway protein H
MTWQAETWGPERRQSGFTLIEMMVVLVVLGLVLGLLLGRGPMRSPVLETRVAAQQVAQMLRLARSRAIALDRPISVTLERNAHAAMVDGMQAQALPPRVEIAAVGVATEPNPAPVIRIGFSPSGGSSGARIRLSELGFAIFVSVDWLSGRVRLDAPG